MAKFSYACDKRTAKISVKKALNLKLAILKDSGDKLVVGAPLMKVTLSFSNNSVTTSANFFGKKILETVNSCLELIDGFIKE